VNDEDKRTMYSELIGATRRPSRDDYPQPNITAQELAKLEGITPAAAYSRLERAFAEGTVKKAKKKIVIDDHPNCIYWMAYLGDDPDD
jgi:CRP-like cAMP-binding protein